MKLAEALQERADLNKKIDELRTRLGSNVLVQEGEKPLEEPADIIRELNSAIDRLQYLTAAVNFTNCKTQVQGITVTELIARKDALKVKVSAYRDAIYRASNITQRTRGSEIKIIAAVDVADLQKKADSLAKELRITDNLLQETNWNTQLIEDES